MQRHNSGTFPVTLPAILFYLMMIFGGVLSAAENTSSSDKPQLRPMAVILAPCQRAVLSAEVPSLVVEVSREMGQSFKKDEPLVRLDATIYQANHDKAAAQVRSAASQLQSKENLLVDGGASVAEAETARMNLAVARSNLILARKQLESCNVTAPFAGRVVKVSINRYEVVQPGQNLIEIVDDSILRAQFLVPSIHIGKLKLKQDVAVAIHETGETVSGKISHIGAVIDPASSTVKVYAEIANPDKKLHAGMRGILTLSLDKP